MNEVVKLERHDVIAIVTVNSPPVNALSAAVRYLLSRFFRNSPELLVLNLLEDEELSRKELRRIQALLAEAPQ